MQRVDGAGNGIDRRARAWSRKRGSALLIALLVLMVMSVVGMALAGTTVQNLRTTRGHRDASTAFNIAESGVEQALLWLRQQPAPPNGALPFNPLNGPVSLGPGSFTVSIDPDDRNPILELRRYTIQSIGVAGRRRETIVLHVQQASFGRYAYFTDSERSSVTNGPIWFTPNDRIDGPAHSNNTSGSDFQINYVGSTSPIFSEGLLTAVSSNINYNPGQPQTEPDFQKIYEDGSRGFRLGVSRIELPESTDQQKVAAWGRTTGFPTTSGVHVPMGGGLYLVGDAALNFSVTSEGWQRLAITQGATVTTVTIKHAANETVVQSGSSTTTYAGTTNGVIYCTGHVTSLRGQLADGLMSGSRLLQRNAYTIATDVVGGKNVTLTDNLTYRTPPDKTRPWDDPLNLRAATLGVVANNVVIAASAPQNLSVHGVMLAGGRNTTNGSFYVSNYNSKSPTGTLNLVGGLIQKKRGPVGTFNSSTGNLSTGYLKNYRYDRRMAVNPPPFFPTTGAYERLSWMRTAAGPVAP